MLQFLPRSNSSMDSLRNPQHQSNYNRLFSGPMYFETRRRGSTSQMHLHKILSIITTVPPPLAASVPTFSTLGTKESSEEDDKGSGFGFDLNVDLCVPPEPKESYEAGTSSSSSTALESGGSAVGDGGCFNVNDENGSGPVENEEHGNEVSDNSYIEIGEAKKRLTLLIEAAKVIFGEFVDDDKSESGDQNLLRCSKLKKDEVTEDIRPIEGELRTAAEMRAEFEESPLPPVVRSKWGRAHVLPGKYRDSVLEPLTRLSRTRSSILPPKRRRR